MKKTTLLTLLVLVVAQLFASSPTWQKMDMTKAAGGTVNLNISRMQLQDGKLYIATYDGIWVSPSGNGGDWQPFGLQGQKVTRLSFGNLKLAMVLVAASNDATKTTGVLYKLNGTAWELTNLNPDKLSSFGSPSSEFTQIRDGNGKDIIFYPTWGGGIWRSDDGGVNWTNYPQGTTDYGAVYKNVLGLHTFPGDNTIYGTDKVHNNNNYLIYSTDYGLTWQNINVGAFFNPHSVYARTLNTKKYIYFGGENGNEGAIWRSENMGNSWDAAFTMGVDYWNCRKITASPNGNLFSMASVNNLYVSKDNGETFEPFAAGLTIPSHADRIANPPATDKYFLSDVIATNSKVYLSTVFREGIYFVDLSTGISNAKNANVRFKLIDNTLYVDAVPNTEIQIMNVTGAILGSYKAQSTSTNINIAHLAPAVYLLKTIGADNAVQINKFIKQ